MNSTSVIRQLIFPALLSCVLLATSFAQTDTATITGVVTDDSAATLPNAAVEVTNKATGVKTRATTNDAGVYVVTALPIGVYDVTVTLSGFQTAQLSNVTLHAGDRARLDVQMRVGELREVVEISAAGRVLLESETSNLSQVIENATITSMPLNGRNYQQLALLSPGVLPSRTRNFVTDSFSVNGANMWQNQFVLDGADNNNYNTGVVTASNQVIKPSIDAIQEFKMETHNFSAEFGRGGGAVIQVTTKSGTNEFRGTLFEFVRNDKFDANDFFNSGRPKPPYRHNQFGGTFGGPIRKNQSFFFGSYQGTRIREKLTRLAIVPTPEQLRGEFGALNIYDPATQNAAGVRQQFADNRIPENRLDPVMLRVLRLYPQPNRADVQNYVYNSPRTTDDEQIDSRVDHRFSDRDSIFVRYSFHDFDRLEPGNLPLPASGSTASRIARAHSAVVSETHVFGGANLVNEFRAAFARNRGLIETGNRERLWEQFGFKGTFDRPDILGLPQFGINGYVQIGDRSNAPDPRLVDIWQAVDNLSWTKGRHALKFGMNFRYFTRRTQIVPFARGVYNFNGQFTAQQAGRGTGNGLADALLGLTSSAQLSNALDISQRSQAWEFYVQDNFKLNQRLTLNLGARYEYQPPFYERRNKYANFVFDQGQPGFGTLVRATGDGAEARSFQQNDPNNFAPRLGLAWRVSERLVVRGGYGIFYDAVAQLPYGSQPSQNPPFYLDTTIPTPNSAATSLVRIQDGFAPTALDASNLNGRALASVWPFAFPDALTQQWNLNLQYSLPWQSIFSVAYVGTDTRHRRITVDRNQPTPGAGALGPRRVFPNQAGILTDVPLGEASYHGLELKFERRFANGFSTLNGYTWSKAMIGDIYQDARNLQVERSLSPEDMRHRFFSSLVYELPFGARRRWLSEGVIGHLVGGWQLSTLFSAQTGLRQTPVVAGNPANTTGAIHADRLGDGRLARDQRTPERWFDVGAFAVPAPLRFGTSGAFVIEGPGYVNLDATLGRDFNLTERVRLQFRAEVFNVFNEAHFDFPNVTINQPAAGRIAATSSPMRQIQFGLKLTF